MGCIRNRTLKLITILALNLIFTSQVVFADNDITISILPSSVEMALTPEVFSSMSQTLTISTSSAAGYTVKIAASGNTNSLIHQSDPTYYIPTFTLPEGSSSLPADSTGYGYGYSIDGGANYLPIPTPGVSQKIFETNSGGVHEHNLTFGALVSAAQASGTYSGAAEIQVVSKLDPCPPNKICYYGNDDDGTGEMPDQDAVSNTDTILIAPNFSRPNYGFAGWNTAIDGSGTDYGPNETINPGDLSTKGLQLYARWVPSSGDLQSWNGCGNMAQNAVIALTDARDGNTYTVTKLADGHCWMMENLRLDLSDQNLNISSFDTNRPTSSFIQAINETHPASTTNFCQSENSTCINSINHNTDNTNRNLDPSYDANDTRSSWYSYGNYYNWYTATAGNGTYELSTGGSSANGDICPANWRLPAGMATVGDLAVLDKAMGGNGKNNEVDSPAGIASSLRWRKYPLNNVLGGEQKAAAANRAISSSYTTLNAMNEKRTVNLWIRVGTVFMSSNTTNKIRGQTVRCLYNPGYHFRGNIHYDANGGTGTMADETDIDFGTAFAANNQFTKAHSEFVSWNSQPDGSGVTVAPGGMVAGAADREELGEGDTLNLYAIWRPSYSIVYNGNNADAGSMDVATEQSVYTGPYQLVAPNYSRTDYGFAGWSLDANATDKLATNQSVTIYGPNETINIDASILAKADPVTHEIVFYAVWIPEHETKTMQTFDAQDCTNLSSVIALKDIRNNDTYAVAKLADGHCWMLENLRLDPAATTLDSDNTNNPTSGFASAASSSETEDTLCNGDNTGCVDTIHFNSNTLNRGYTPSYKGNIVKSSWYSYGIMYNWFTASAGNGTFSMETGNVAGDICPKGWRLATGGSGGEYAALDNALGKPSANKVDTNFRKYPNNFIYSGDYNYNKPGGRNTYGRWWSATPNGQKNAFRLGIVSSGATPTGSWNKWDAFAIRCIVKEAN